MQAIQTKWYGPTNHQGSRIVAKCDARRITIPYDHALSVSDNHRKAAEKLLDLMGWSGKMHSGVLPDGAHAHVIVFK